MAMTDSPPRMRRCLKALCPRSFSLLRLTAWLRSRWTQSCIPPNRKERYERLPDDSQAVIEEQQEEIESMEAEAEEEKEAKPNRSYSLITSMWKMLSTTHPLSVLSLHSVKKA